MPHLIYSMYYYIDEALKLCFYSTAFSRPAGQQELKMQMEL